MKKLSILLLALLIFSCKKQDNEPVVTSAMEVYIGDEKFNMINEQIGSNSNCSSLFVSARFYNGDDNGFRLEFQLSDKGAIKQVTSHYYRDGNRYESVNFNPAEVLKIKSFRYDPKERDLYFELDGDLYEFDPTDIDRPQKTQCIRGKVEIKNLKDIACESAFSDFAFETKDLRFLTQHFFALKGPSNEGGYRKGPIVYDYHFFSEDGYYVLIKSDKDLAYLPQNVGHKFGTENAKITVTLSKFIGKPRATILWRVREQDWIVYQCAGSYEVKEEVVIKGDKMRKGVLRFDVLDKGKVIHQVNHADLLISGFSQ